MRLLLDAHISPKRAGTRLREDGHDVLALDEEPSRRDLRDLDILALAAMEGRILVTFDTRDVVPLLRRWAEAERSHAGCILVYGVDHADFGPLLRGLRQLFTERPRQDDWVNLTLTLPVVR